MSRHVAPERWADALAGRLDERARAQIEQHAETCQACARARARVGRASDAFAAIRSQAGPELPWDSVRARVHWSVSKERRARTSSRRGRSIPRLGWAALAATCAGALGLIAVDRLSGAAPATPPSAAGASPPRASTPELVSPDVAARVFASLEPRPLAGLVNRATGDVRIDGSRPADLFGTRLVAGMVVSTGDARVDVQFGDGSAFALGPRSTVELRRFDEAEIELVLDGTLDLEVAPRERGQRLLVVAGERTVEVRGTQFRVHHEAGAVRVACRHGRVAVRDHAAEVEVAAAQHVRVPAAGALADARAIPLTSDELTELAEATPLRMPLWNLDALTSSSAPLEVATAGGRDVRVDGIELGRAPLRVRVMPGRHTVEAADAHGRFRRAGWIDVAAPFTGAAPARIELPAEPSPTSGVKQRQRQLHAGLDRRLLARCVRTIAKAGLTDTYVEIELAVDAAGAVGFLNIIDTDLPSATARCVRDVLAEVPFERGAAATWRERIEL